MFFEKHKLMYYLLLLPLVVWLHYGIPYAVGMAEYASVNNKKSRLTELRDIKKSLMDEYRELQDAIRKREPIEIFLEFFDVFHSCIKLLIAKISIDLLYFHVIWFLVFPLIIPVGIKHSRRYIRNGCIRNHKNKANLDHKCRYIE